MSSDIVLSAGVRNNLLSLQNTAASAALTENRLATGKKVNSALDNPTNFFTSSSLLARSSDLNSLLDQIGLATQTLTAASQGITSLTSLVQSAKSIASQARASTLGAASAISVTNTAQAETAATLTTGAITTAPAAGTFTFTVAVAGTSSATLTASVASGDNAAAIATDIQTAVNADTVASGHVAVTASGGKLVFTNADVNTHTTINNSAFTSTIALSASTSGTTTENSTSLLDNIIAAGGAAGTSNLQLTVNGGTTQTITFGTAAGQVHDLAGLTTALAALSTAAPALTVTTSGGGRTLAFAVGANGSGPNSLQLAGSTGVTTALGSTNATTNGAEALDPTRQNLATQYNALLAQIDQLAGDSSFNGINLLNGDQLKVVFNEKNTSSITIQGVTFNSVGLGLAQVVGTAAGSGFQSNASVDATITTIQNALGTLRSQASAFGSNLSTIQTRQDFTKNLVNTLQTGSDGLVLADTNAEGASLLALQTRQQLSTTALSLANQANQAVLRLFG
jgi:flagellin